MTTQAERDELREMCAPDRSFHPILRKATLASLLDEADQLHRLMRAIVNGRDEGVIEVNEIER